MPPKAATVAVSENDWNMVLALLSQKSNSDFDMHKAADDLDIKAPALSMRWSRFQTKYQAQLNRTPVSGQPASSATTSKATTTPKNAAPKGKGKGKKAAKKDDSGSDVELNVDEETQKVKGKKTVKHEHNGSEEEDEEAEQEEQSDDQN